MEISKCYKNKIFKSREEAGVELALHLTKYNPKNTIILAIPRGGVTIGFEVAKVGKFAMNVFVSRKISLPEDPELAIGAITENDILLVDTQLLKYMNIPKERLESIILKQKEEIKRRVQIYRKGLPLPILKNKNIILIDDGVATGYTFLAAIEGLKKYEPKKIIAALPICSKEAKLLIENTVDETVILKSPARLYSIGRHYCEFPQLKDEEVIELLQKTKDFNLT